MANDEEARVFDSIDEAKQHKPDDKPNWNLFRVTSADGKSWFTWNGTPNSALAIVMGHLSWSCGVAEPKRGAITDEQAIARIRLVDRTKLTEALAELGFVPKAKKR